MKELVLLIAIGLFLAALIFRFIWGLRLGRQLPRDDNGFKATADIALTRLLEDANGNAKVREVLREISRRAPGLDTPERRAAYHSAAGYLSLQKMKRPALAVGFYLRALREDPACLRALDELQNILVAQKRFRRLERTYWDVLGRLDDTYVGQEIWLKCWSGLASLYSASPRTLRRADAIRKALAAFGPEEQDEIVAPVNFSNLSS